MVENILYPEQERLFQQELLEIVVDVSEYISKIAQNKRLLTSVLLYKDMIYYGFRINASKMLFTFIATYLVHAILSKFR